MINILVSSRNNTESPRWYLSVYNFVHAKLLNDKDVEVWLSKKYSNFSCPFISLPYGEVVHKCADKETWNKVRDMYAKEFGEEIEEVLEKFENIKVIVEDWTIERNS